MTEQDPRGESPDSADSVVPFDGAVVEAATGDSTASLLNRITALEGREHALNAELAVLRADIDRLKQEFSPESGTVLLVEDVEVAFAHLQPDSAGSLGTEGPADHAIDDGRFSGGAGGSPVEQGADAIAISPADAASIVGHDQDSHSDESPDRFGPIISFTQNGPVTRLSASASTDIDDLIQEVVASREREALSLTQSPETPADDAALPDPEQVSTASIRDTPDPDEGKALEEEKAPDVNSVEEFFIRPASSRKGRS